MALECTLDGERMFDERVIGACLVVLWGWEEVCEEPTATEHNAGRVAVSAVKEQTLPDIVVPSKSVQIARCQRQRQQGLVSCKFCCRDDVWISRSNKYRIDTGQE
jgi:hypothetical protein